MRGQSCQSRPRSRAFLHSFVGQLWCSTWRLPWASLLVVLASSQAWYLPVRFADAMCAVTHLSPPRTGAPATMSSRPLNTVWATQCCHQISSCFNCSSSKHPPSTGHGILPGPRSAWPQNQNWTPQLLAVEFHKSLSEIGYWTT